MELSNKDLENIVGMCECWIDNNIFHSNGELTADELQQNKERSELREKALKELKERGI